jgi:thymidylate synthase ThyX
MAEAGSPLVSYVRRVSPLDAHELTAEQIAVVFAMTSRRPEPFDEIAKQVSQEKAADFHERWVLGYGHASVAEHAVLHLAVENVSRLACDTLEDNRLASYTEKSSRYQVMPPDYFYHPPELDQQPEVSALLRETCRGLFGVYRRLIDGCMDHLRRANPRREGEREPAHNMRMRRVATDSCRAVLPAATMTNVGVTANARVLEHAVSKLLSSGLAEERGLGQELLQASQKITPTLIKYAALNPYLAEVAEIQRGLARRYASEGDEKSTPRSSSHRSSLGEAAVKLVHWDPQAEAKLATALLFRYSALDYGEIWRRVGDMGPEDRQAIIDRCLASLGPHDAPVRELELVDYTFEYLLDYGAYREFKRHRMQSYVPQPLTVAHGYRVPPLLVEAGLKVVFEEAMGLVEHAYPQLHQHSPLLAQYLVTHAHNRRVISKLNLRECYHLFKLRTSELAHFSIREPVLRAMEMAVEIHPGLFRHLLLRDYPDWWPFPKPGEG